MQLVIYSEQCCLCLCVRACQVPMFVCVWRMPREIHGSCLKQIRGSTVATCDLGCIVAVVCYYGAAGVRALGNLQHNTSPPTTEGWWGIFFFSYQRCPVNVVLLFLYLTMWLPSFREYLCLECNLAKLNGIKCSRVSKPFVLSSLWLFLFNVSRSHPAFLSLPLTAFQCSSLLLLPTDWCGFSTYSIVAWRSNVTLFVHANVGTHRPLVLGKEAIPSAMSSLTSTILHLGDACLNLEAQKTVFVLIMPGCVCCSQVFFFKESLGSSCFSIFFYELLVRKTLVSMHDAFVLQPGGNYESCQKLPDMWYCLQGLGVHLCGLCVSLMKVFC